MVGMGMKDTAEKAMPYKTQPQSARNKSCVHMQGTEAP